MNNIVALENGVEIHLPEGFVMSNLMYEPMNDKRYISFNIKEPKKTLWDKRTRINDGYFELPDVKEALKELIEWNKTRIDETGQHSNEHIIFKEVVTQIFGEELVK